MKRFLLLPLALASCGLFGVPTADISGNILGTQPSGSIRLAMRGVTLAGVQTPTLDQVNLGTFNPEKRVYAVSLPGTPAEGGYELLAYVDANANNKYDAGETRTQVTGSTFVYLSNGLGDKSGSNLLNLKPGWTLVTGITPGKNGAPFTSYDLNW